MSKARDIADSTTTLDVDGGTIKLDGNYPVGTGNVALGNTALDSVTTGEYNTAIGDVSLTANTTGVSNVSLGAFSMENNVGGNYNTSVGMLGLRANTSGANNTGLGYGALRSNTTASYNTAVGYQAGYSSTTAERNTNVGFQSGHLGTTGSYNTMLGMNAGFYVTTGSKNTIVGQYTGNQGGLDIRTSSNNIVLSDGDGNPRGIFNSSGHFIVGGTDASFNNTAKVALRKNTDSYFIAPTTAVTFNRTNGSGTLLDFRQGAANISGTISVTTSSASYNTSSDYRLKENVVELTGATDRLKQLNPSRFNFIADADTTVDGFIAHEVQAIVPEAVTGTHNEVDADGNPVYQGIDQSKLVPLLVATIQELEARITALEGA